MSQHLRAAYEARLTEYEVLRAGQSWSGAILHAGTLVEIAFKLVICKHLGVSKLPAIFQVHDWELLLYCSGYYGRIMNDNLLQSSFAFICDKWSISMRYEGATRTTEGAGSFHVALFDAASGILTFLSQHF